MKTVLNSKSPQSEIKAGLNNPAGMLISNDPTTRANIASAVDKVLQNIRSKKALNDFNAEYQKLAFTENGVAVDRERELELREKIEALENLIF